jgi:hypothetical protein
MAKSGIYQIRNTRNGKIYIGSTDNFKRRKREHFANLKLNKHDNIILQRAYNKNKNEFVFEIYFICPPDLCEFYEQRCLDILNNKYNINPYADRPPKAFGRKPWNAGLPKEMQPMFGKSSSRKGLTLEQHHMHGRTGKKHPKSIPVIETNTLKIYDSANLAAIELGIPRSHISRMCKGFLNESKGHKFAYLEDYKNGSIKNFLNGRYMKPVINLNTGVSYKSATEAAKILKLRQGSISSVCRGEKKRTGGFKFLYLDDFNKLKVSV